MKVAKFSYTPSRKTLEKQAETIEKHVQKQVEVLKSLDLNNHQMQSYQPQKNYLKIYSQKACWITSPSINYINHKKIGN